MASLELKVPPPAVALLLGFLMWLASPLVVSVLQLRGGEYSSGSHGRIARRATIECPPVVGKYAEASHTRTVVAGFQPADKQAGSPPPPNEGHDEAIYRL